MSVPLSTCASPRLRLNGAGNGLRPLIRTLPTAGHLGTKWDDFRIHVEQEFIFCDRRISRHARLAQSEKSEMVPFRCRGSSLSVSPSPALSVSGVESVCVSFSASPSPFLPLIPRLIRNVPFSVPARRGRNGVITDFPASESRKLGMTPFRLPIPRLIRNVPFSVPARRGRNGVITDFPASESRKLVMTPFRLPENGLRPLICFFQFPGSNLSASPFLPLRQFADASGSKLGMSPFPASELGRFETVRPSIRRLIRNVPFSDLCPLFRPSLSPFPSPFPALRQQIRNVPFSRSATKKSLFCSLIFSR